MKLLSKQPADSPYSKTSPAIYTTDVHFRSSSSNNLVKERSVDCLLSRPCRDLKMALIAQKYAISIEKNHYEFNMNFTRKLPQIRDPPLNEGLIPQHYIQHPLKTSARISPMFLEISKIKKYPFVGDQKISQLKEFLEQFLGLSSVKHDPSPQKNRLREISFNRELTEQITMASILKMKPEMFFNLATSSKESSICLQILITESQEKHLGNLAVLMKPYLPQLIIHPFGNFVIQRLISRHLLTLGDTINFAKEAFSDLIANEYSSRVIQVLIETCSDFRTFCLHFFRHNFDASIQSNSASLLLVACIANSRDSRLCGFVVDNLRYQPRILSNKFFKKILISFIQIASDEQMDWIAWILKVPIMISELFSRKASSATVMALIERKHQLTLEALYMHLESCPGRLFDSKFFSVSIHRHSVSIPASVARRVVWSLVSLDCAAVKKLGQSSSIICQLLYTILALHSEEQKPMVMGFITRKDVSQLLPRISDWRLGSFHVPSTAYESVPSTLASTGIISKKTIS